MTDLSTFDRGDAVGEGRFYIWDRSLGQFVATDAASDEQMRLYGSAVYTEFGSGQNRVMTVFDPQGEPTSYAVSQSTRRGELVPASRAAGRAGVAAQRRLEQARAARSVQAARQTAAVKRGEFQADMAERRQKIEALQVDFQNETLWQEMNAYTKQLLYSDPSLLEDVELRGGLDTATVMDYVFFGTPTSPGLFMEGVSNEYVWIPELRRFKNAMFASEEERMNSKVYTREEAVASNLGQFEPLGETLQREIVEPARAVGGALQRALPGWFGSSDEFENFPNFPDNAFQDQRRTTPQMGVEVVKVANPDVLGPWIASNYELLTPAQQRKIDDLVEGSRATYSEDAARTMSPEEQRMARGRGYNPWDSIDNRTRPIREARDATPEMQAETAAAAVYGVSPEQRAAAVEEEEARRARMVGRQAVERRQFLNSLANSVENTIIGRYAQYEFTSLPLGFVSDEFLEVQTRLSDDPRYQQITQEITQMTQRGEDASALQRAQQEMMMGFQPETVLMFRGESIPFTRAENELIEQQRGFTRGRLLSPSERVEMEGRGRRLQASATRRMLTEGNKPLTQADAMTRLRGISRDPVKMSQLKQRLLSVPGADETEYVTDTSMDGHTMALWQETVALANNEGVDPEYYLAQLSLDPLARDRAAKAARSYKSSGGGAGFTIRLPSTDDVATIVQDVAYRRIGQRLDNEQAKQVAQAYVNMAESQYRSQQGATTITEPMSAETFAQQQITQQFGGDEMLYQTGLQLDTLIEMIGG